MPNQCWLLLLEDTQPDFKPSPIQQERVIQDRNRFDLVLKTLKTTFGTTSNGRIIIHLGKALTTLTI
jgi:hypothetical protein